LGMMSFLSPARSARSLYPLPSADTRFGSSHLYAPDPGSSPFPVYRVAYKPATRYAEEQMCLAVPDSRVLVTRLASRWLHKVEAEKPIQIFGRPERVERMAQATTSLTRWPVLVCEGRKTERRDERRASVDNRRIWQRKRRVISD
jgi:hypothetical protein